MRWPWRRTKRVKHRHDWVRLGYGGAGWSAFKCRTCGAHEIDA